MITTKNLFIIYSLFSLSQSAIFSSDSLARPWSIFPLFRSTVPVETTPPELTFQEQKVLVDNYKRRCELKLLFDRTLNPIPEDNIEPKKYFQTMLLETLEILPINNVETNAYNEAIATYDSNAIKLLIATESCFSHLYNHAQSKVGANKVNEILREALRGSPHLENFR